ncbi:hypothetical protein SY88_20505 [Clostridiales bacterium PH28_bin88]|nr:hypothetical protein SY88_20505 [Clostridiales bacterium PH28_bin88]
MKGKVVLITGAGSGIGRATALLFASNGADAIVLGDINKDKLNQVAEEIRELGAEATTIEMDVSDPVSVENGFELIQAKYQKIDVLVNSAGICLVTPFNEITVAEWNSVMNTNLLGTFLCCQEAIKNMAAHGIKGAIVNISSIAGKVGGQAAGAHYAASKAGVNCLTFAAARHAAKYGIRVNAVAPGPIDTDMTKVWDVEVKTRLSANTPLGHFGKAQDVAEAIFFLASSKASHITGEVLDINGGALMD